MPCLATLLGAAPAQQLATQYPPTTWVDKDTGHRFFRITDEPNSSALYFNFDAHTPDSRDMVYSSPAGIHLLGLATRKTRLLVAHRARHASPAEILPTPELARRFAPKPAWTPLQRAVVADPFVAEQTGRPAPKYPEADPLYAGRS